MPPKSNGSLTPIPGCPKANEALVAGDDVVVSRPGDDLLLTLICGNDIGGVVGNDTGGAFCGLENPGLSWALLGSGPGPTITSGGPSPAALALPIPNASAKPLARPPRSPNPPKPPYPPRPLDA